MCKYLFSFGQVPKIIFLEPSFIQYIDSVAYLHFQHIPIYIQKFVRAGTNTLKPMRPSIYLLSHRSFFILQNVYYSIFILPLPSLPIQYKAQRVYVISYLHRHLNTVSSSENYIFLYGTLALLLSVLFTS